MFLFCFTFVGVVVVAVASTVVVAVAVVVVVVVTVVISAVVFVVAVAANDFDTVFFVIVGVVVVVIVIINVVFVLVVLSVAAVVVAAVVVAAVVVAAVVVVDGVAVLFSTIINYFLAFGGTHTSRKRLISVINTWSTTHFILPRGSFICFGYLCAFSFVLTRVPFYRPRHLVFLVQALSSNPNDFHHGFIQTQGAFS